MRSLSGRTVNAAEKNRATLSSAKRASCGPAIARATPPYSGARMCRPAASTPALGWAERELVTGGERSRHRAERGRKICRAGAEDPRQREPAAHGHVREPRVGADPSTTTSSPGRASTLVHPGTGPRVRSRTSRPVAATTRRSSQRNVNGRPMISIAASSGRASGKVEGRGERHGIGRTGRGDTRAQVSEAPAVLDRRTQPRRADAHHRGTNRSRSPARMSAAGSRAGSNVTSSVRPMSRHPPGESTG